MADKEGPELVFALVGATGTDLGETAKCLGQALEAHTYKSVHIRLSDLITKFALDIGPLKKFEDERIEQAMARGTAIRDAVKHGDGVVRFAVQEIAAERKRKTGAIDRPAPRQAYILRGLKHPDEVKTLRRIYNDTVHILAVYEPKDVRIKRLEDRIKTSRRPRLANPSEAESAEWRRLAEVLVARDENEKENRLGQHLQDTFHLADFFLVKEVTSEKVSEQIDKYIALLFGARFITPTLDEVGSFQAQAAALRSADLSRQVGAVITLKDGSGIVSGYNEVPAAGGGHFIEGRDSRDCDHRDYMIEMDASAAAKNQLLTEIFRALLGARWLKKTLLKLTAEELTDRAINNPVKRTDGEKPILADTQITGLLEFGRCVHAEMSALMEAARKGRSVEGSTLYCTTFPCHMCARHIIAAGISRVVFIEPYQKSKAKALYPDAIMVDGEVVADKKAVRFDHFFGVAPRRYMRMFQALPRKDKSSGYSVSPDFRELIPRDYAAFPVYRDIETWYIKTISSLIRRSQGTI